MNAEDWGICSTEKTQVGEALTIDKLNEMLKLVPPEPFGQRMAEAGMPPEDGYELHLPVHLNQRFPHAPSYVKFSRAVSEPIIIKTFPLYGTLKYDYTNG